MRLRSADDALVLPYLASSPVPSLRCSILASVLTSAQVVPEVPPLLAADPDILGFAVSPGSSLRSAVPVSDFTSARVAAGVILTVFSGAAVHVADLAGSPVPAFVHRLALLQHASLEPQGFAQLQNRKPRAASKLARRIDWVVLVMPFFLK